MERLIKIGLALILFVCLLRMPYGYYQFVRIVAMIGFALLAYEASINGSRVELIVFIGLAVLFQPLIKIPLGRTIWNIVDVIVGVGLLVSLADSRKGAGT